MDIKGKDCAVLQDEKWKCELAFLADVTAHLDALDLQFQGRDRMITDTYDAVKAFQVKLHLWKTQMHAATCLTFPVMFPSNVKQSRRNGVSECALG